jgi:endonuclease/exonuclease/phosphatase family metal-dependent hydrolase
MTEFKAISKLHWSEKYYHHDDSPGTRVRLLSYNIQVGIATNKPHHYLTRSWRHLLPHGHHFNNLDEIAKVIKGYDIVGLQEVDAGSLRSSFVNQVNYLAERAGFNHWYHQRNRNLGHIACHANGLLSRYATADVANHKLPGVLPGRGAMVARYGERDNPLVVVLLHLALGRRARMRQLSYVADIVGQHQHVVVMGDMNCLADSEEMQLLLDNTGLTPPELDLPTFPSWRPSRTLDHILVSPSLSIENIRVLSDVDVSDHLPISMEIVVPKAVKLVA